MTGLVLAIFDLLSPLLRLAGVDYPRFRAILEVKLTLDGRRQGFMLQRADGKQSKAAFALALGVNAVFGLFVAATMLLCGSALVGLTIELSFVMTMVGMMLIADYSSVLLDTTDNQILQPRPVSSRTILAARLAHIIAYLSLLTFSLAAGAFVFGTFKFGIVFVPCFAAALLLALLLVVAVVNVVYLLAMRMVDGEKLRDMILYFQIAMTVLVTASYQIMPHLIDMAALKTLDISNAAWVYAYPPTWFAGAVDFALGQHGPAQRWLALLGLLGPAAAVLLVALLAPIFRTALARLDVDSASTARRGAGRVSPAWGETFARRLCRRPIERAAFAFLWSLVGRDRQFKLRVYPLAVFGLLVGAAILFQKRASNSFSLDALRQSKSYLFLLYVNCMMLPSALLQFRYSDRYEAAWLYGFLPLPGPGDVLVAALKILLVRFVSPAYALAAIVVLALWGPRVLPDILVAYCATLFLMTLAALCIGRRLPFSEKLGVIESSGRAAFLLVMLLIPAALGGSHFLLAQMLPPAILALAPLLLAGSWGAMTAYRATTWRHLQLKGSEQTQR